MTRALVSGVVVLGVVGSLYACAAFGTSDAGAPVGPLDSAIEDAIAPSTDAGTDGPGTASGCPTTPPVMVRVGSFCIDRTEVTQEQYGQFLLSAPSTSGQPAGCENNTSFVQRTDGPIELDQATVPVSVTWCDAFMYCQWAGKRLCGAPGGGSSVYGTTDPANSEWLQTCSAGGTRPYPYGLAFDGPACNVGPWSDSGALAAVGSFPECKTASGVLDMAGNASEWLNECDPPPNGLCAHRGGNYGSGDGRCGQFEGQPRTEAYYSFGFRCCADAH